MPHEFTRLRTPYRATGLVNNNAIIFCLFIFLLDIIGNKIFLQSLLYQSFGVVVGMLLANYVSHTRFPSRHLKSSLWLISTVLWQFDIASLHKSHSPPRFAHLKSSCSKIYQSRSVLFRALFFGCCVTTSFGSYPSKPVSFVKLAFLGYLIWLSSANFLSCFLPSTVGLK